ncbi:hypothetical protein SAMN04487996_1373 [Dyadobacter soli]|uniref:Alpha/beta hydrolase family protein n=2 Tax=Dyadobacter soli TaxID=659014 RepID=A0A1G8CB33_9BACT|nr:hypothetical protein SAMN04487996_1373 [Dyadobacter soli]
MLIVWASLPAWVCRAQSRVPALDSMGANMARENWKAAIHWALKAGEAIPSEKYWRYLNAADFASRDRNKELALHYAALVADSDIAVKARFGESFAWLKDDPQWQQLTRKIADRKEAERQAKIKSARVFRDEQKAMQAQTDAFAESLSQIGSAEALYKAIRQGRPPRQYPRGRNFVYGWTNLDGKIELPYLVQLPPGFDGSKAYPVVVVLHGAVAYQPETRDVPDSVDTFFGRFFMRMASESGFIAVFPYGTKTYNWMMPEDGFGLVPEVLRQVKRLFPVDDSRVYITGHSNGATGAFSYLMKQPSLFAGFSGINNRPQVRTGGTFFRNALNRSFYNVATDYDYYFPLEGHQGVTRLATQLGINWQNREILGKRTHGFLINDQSDESLQVYTQLFADMASKKRNPFRERLYWECEDTQNGRCDWLEITRLDTLANAQSWQTPVNVPVTGWRKVMNPAELIDSTSNAFQFPRRSGAVQATYAGNRFELTTSWVGKVKLFLSPEMIDFAKPLQVRINGKQVFASRVEMDKALMLSSYRRESDHQAVWAASLELAVP